MNANYFTSRHNKLGGNLDGLPDDAFYNFVSNAVTTGIPGVFGVGVVLVPGVITILTVLSPQRTIEGILRTNIVTNNFQTYEYYKVLAARKWENVKSIQITTDKGYICISLISNDVFLQKSITLRFSP